MIVRACSPLRMASMCSRSACPAAEPKLVRTYVGAGGARRRAATVRVSSQLSRQEKPMRTAATRPPTMSTLSLAFELGNAEWKLALTPRIDQPPLVRTIPARDLTRLDRETRRALTHFGLPADTPVQSCYEAGRDGFWLHRYLTHRGVANQIVDSSSIEVNRRRRRAKTDRLGAGEVGAGGRGGAAPGGGGGGAAAGWGGRPGARRGPPRTTARCTANSSSCGAI